MDYFLNIFGCFPGSFGFLPETFRVLKCAFLFLTTFHCVKNICLQNLVANLTMFNHLALVMRVQICEKSLSQIREKFISYYLILLEMPLGKYWATSVIHAKPAVTSMCKDDVLKRFSPLFVRAIKKAWGVEHLLSLRMFRVNNCLNLA